MFSLPGGFTYAAEPSPDGVATITVTPAGPSPKAIQIAMGSRVRFVNNDARPHDLVSDPHPLHTDCQEMNAVGLLVPGANAQTGAFALPRTCGFHDHNDGTNPAWMGRIIIR
jgi:plastocyanin